MSFLAELRRRNVIRVLIAYLAGAWLLIQIADVVLPRLGVPDQVLTILIIVVAIGFVPAVVISWAFEWLDKSIGVGRGVIRFAHWDPFLENLRQDPRWPEFIARHWFTKEALEDVEFDLLPD